MACLDSPVCRIVQLSALQSHPKDIHLRLSNPQKRPLAREDPLGSAHPSGSTALSSRLSDDSPCQKKDLPCHNGYQSSLPACRVSYFQTGFDDLDEYVPQGKRQALPLIQATLGQGWRSHRLPLVPCDRKRLLRLPWLPPGDI